MTENQIQENDRKKTTLDLIHSYLANGGPHRVANLVGLVSAYATSTPTGRLLFGSQGKSPKSFGRAALKQSQNAGGCIVNGTGTAQTIKLTQKPKYVRGNTKLLRDADAEAKAAIITRVEKGDTCLISALHDVVEKLLRPKLQSVMGIPEVFMFALFRRVIDGLVEDGTCDRGLIPHDGDQVEVIKKHEDGDKPRRGKKSTSKPKQKDAKVTDAVASETAPDLDLTLTAQDRQDFRHALGIPTSARKSAPLGQSLEQAVADAAPVLAYAAWASASEADRKRFLAQQLADPQTAARVREILLGSEAVTAE